MKNYERLMLGMALCMSASQVIRGVSLHPMTPIEMFLAGVSAVIMVAGACYGFWFWMKTIDDLVRPKDSTK